MKPPLAMMMDVDFKERYWHAVDTTCTIVASSSWPAALRYIVAAVNACHRAGLTVEELEGGAIGSMVESLRSEGIVADARAALAPFMKTAE